MAAPTWFVISFMVLISLAICSAQPVTTDIGVRGSGGGFGIVGGGGGQSGFGIGIGGGGFGVGIGGGGSFGIDIGGRVPGFGFPIYIPGFDFPVYSPACGYVCPANNPNGEITELKISGLSHLTRPYRCRAGPNMSGDKDSNNELLLQTVSTIQDKRENKQQRLHYEGLGGDVGLPVWGGRRLGFGRGSGRSAGGSDTSDQYDTKDSGRSYNGCGYVCPGSSPSGGINEFHISGLSHFNGPYRCRPDTCDTEDCGEFLLQFASHQSEPQEEEIMNAIPYPPPPQLEEGITNASPYPPPPQLEEEITNANAYPPPPQLEEEITNANAYPPPPKLEEGITNASPYPPPHQQEEGITNASPYPPPLQQEEGITNANANPPPPQLAEGITKASPYPPPPQQEEGITNASPYPPPPQQEEGITNASPYPPPHQQEEEITNASPYPPHPNPESKKKKLYM